jgi:hypothetical protein
VHVGAMWAGCTRFGLRGGSSFDSAFLVGYTYLIPQSGMQNPGLAIF